MKRLVLVLFLAGLVCAVPPVHAQQTYPLGIADVAVKVDWFHFTDSSLGDLSLQNSVYVGLETYFALACVCPNLYLGLEAGWAGPSNDVNFGNRQFADVDLNVNYVPIEFNAKYVFDITPCLKFDLGGGISANWFNLDVSVRRNSFSSSDWLFGGQFFSDINYRFAHNWFIGANVKYQLTQDIELNGINTNTSANNVRVGGQLGFIF